MLIAAAVVASIVPRIGVEAGESVPIVVGATIPDSVELVVTGLGAPFTTELSVSDTQDVGIADIVLTSTSPNGFQITLYSLNQGKLVREGGSPQQNSDFAPYLLDLEDRPGGVLGVALPAPQERRDLDLSLGTEIIRFDDNVVGPTTQKMFALEIHTEAKAGLFAGTYTDTVTVTVEDL